MTYEPPLRDPIERFPDDADAFVRGVLGAIDVEGCPTDLQCKVIAAVNRAVFGILTDVRHLAPLRAADAAARIPAPAWRRRLIQCAVALELLEAPTAELSRHVSEYARALHVHEPMVHAARAAAHGHLAVMYADIQRSSYYTEEMKHELLHGHAWRLLRSKIAYTDVVASRTIERKWRALADLPAGTWGAGVAEFYRVHQFPVPGERKGIGEIGAHHDFVHVLADYPPSPEGEIDVFAFIATAMDDPKGFVQFVMTLGLFQNQSITHVAGKSVALARARTLDDPGAIAHLADAFSRGVLCRVDALGIDHFSLADRPLAELREKFGIPPRRDATQPGALDRA